MPTATKKTKQPDGPTRRAAVLEQLANDIPAIATDLHLDVMERRDFEQAAQQADACLRTAAASIVEAKKHVTEYLAKRKS